MLRHNQIGTVGEIDPRAVQQITAMIEDMRRVVRLLEEDIAAAELRSRVHDKAHVAYPLDARAMGERRDNLTKDPSPAWRNVSLSPVGPPERGLDR